MNKAILVVTMIIAIAVSLTIGIQIGSKMAKKVYVNPTLERAEYFEETLNDMGFDVTEKDFTYEFWVGTIDYSMWNYHLSDGKLVYKHVEKGIVYFWYFDDGIPFAYAP